ncbi:BPSL0067 family protein [Sphingomonas jatrophae]|uniref:BPSL0067 family protein n=1 Tax=Sphingomonas jatrophae TaxID=1166337 RepID=A0A1I6M211_9SPHN|nr:BPSL0067 family protein [Sphingomonas jatrophae]SFS09674.1 hypothetical protein SAMN05192580_3312 [Sphingomonas jatrophae]
MAGPYVYAEVEDLEGTDKVGGGQCVALVQHYTSAPLTANWTEGAVVKGQTLLAKGTAIATFVGGKYPNKAHGNHAALYISQDATGITVMDQWTKKANVSSRKLLFKGKDKNGNFIDPSNNADAFSVIR